jgi:hypothetical protein
MAQVADLSSSSCRLEDLVALLVDDLALVVGDVVVFEQLLADVEVARLDLALRALDAAVDDAGLDGLALGHLQPVHDGAHAVAREDAHQRVVQAQVEAAGARVALAAAAAAQLVVDAPALVALGGHDAQAAQRLDLLVQALPLVLQLSSRARLLVVCQASSASRNWICFSTLPPSTMSVPRPAMLVAMVIIFGRPAWATISASLACCLALSTWCGSLALVSSRR